MFFRGIKSVYFENHSQHTSTLSEQNENPDNVKSRRYTKQALCFKEVTEHPEISLTCSSPCINIIPSNKDL